MGARTRPAWIDKPLRIAVVGEVKITGKNQLTLPAEAVRELGWKRGDHITVQILNDELVLRRQPDWVEEAGRLTGIFGTHEDTIKYLEELRREWDPQ